MLPLDREWHDRVGLALDDLTSARRLWLRVIPIPRLVQRPFNAFHRWTRPEAVQRRKLERQQRARDRKRLSDCRKYAKIAERRIQRLLVRRKKAEFYSIENQARVSVVKFDFCLVPQDGSGLLFHIDGIHLPRGILIEDLLLPEVTDAISRDIGRTVTSIDTREQCGAFLVVNLGEGVRRLPRIYHWYQKDRLDNVMELLPKTKPSEIAVGMGENRRLHTFDFRSVHCLVAGATGWGKTNWVRQALVTLVERNDPDRLRLVLFDFKRGAGLRIFDGIPHMWTAEASNLSRAWQDEYRETNLGFVSEKVQVENILRAISMEMDHRYEIFGRAGAEDIDSYNKYKHNKLPDLLIVIDELADLMLDPTHGREYRKEIEALILRVAQQGRGAGVFLWAATQTPKREVITTLIKYNLVIKIAFNCTHRSASMIVLDSGQAAGLETRGRMIFQRPGDPGTELQAPLLEHADAKERLGILKQDAPPREDPIPEQEIFRYAIRNMRGALAQNELRNQFNGRVIQKDLWTWLATLDYQPADQGPMFVVDGQGYVVIEGKGNKPRRLWPIQDETQMPDQEEYERVASLSARAQEQIFTSSMSQVATEDQ